jgi:hypothetical protein
MKAYRYVFYKLYTWFRKSDVAEYKALAGICISTSSNFLTVLTIIGIILGKKIHLPDLPRTTLTIIATGVLLIHGFLLVFNDRYIHIIKEFEHENEVEKRRGNLFVFLYVFGSIVLLLALMYVQRLILG